MKKKICIFSGYFPLQQGGAEYQAYLIANSLDKRFFNVFFIMFSQDEERILQKDDFTIYTIKFNKNLLRFGNPYFLYFSKIKKILLKEKPQVVYRRMGAAMPGMLSLIKTQVPFKLIWACAHITDLEKVRLPEPRYFFDFFDDLLRVYGIRHADQILVQTYEQQRLLRKNFNRPSIVFRNLHPKPKQLINKRDDIIQIVWIANIKKWKRPEIFIRLAEHFQHDKKIRFIMIGRLDKSRFSILIKEKLQVLDNIEYKGELPIEVVNHILEKSHIFINTSRYEGFPNTFIQAWMRQVPVISLSVDPDHILKGNHIGFHSVTFDQLVADTRVLIENRRLRNEMGKNAEQYASVNHSLDNIQRLVRLLDS